MSQLPCFQKQKSNVEASSRSQVVRNRIQGPGIRAGHEPVAAASPKPPCTTQSNQSPSGLTLLDSFRAEHSPETYMIDHRQPGISHMALPVTPDRNMGQRDSEQADGQLLSPTCGIWATPYVGSCSGDEFDSYLIGHRSSGLSYTTSPEQPPASQWSPPQSYHFSNAVWNSPATSLGSSQFPNTQFYGVMCPDGLPYEPQAAAPSDPSGLGSSMAHLTNFDHPSRNGSLGEPHSGSYQYPPPPQYQNQLQSAYSDPFGEEPLSPCSTSLKFKLEDHHGELSPAAQPELEEQGTATIGHPRGAGGGRTSKNITTAAAAAAKVDEPYARLIWRAFKSSPNLAMSLQDIYQWFRDNTDKAKISDNKGWQNSIRHNLSMNKAFTKKELKDARASGGFHSEGSGTNGAAKKSTVWILEPWAIAGVHSTTRYRKPNPSRRGGSSTTRRPSKAHEPTASGRASSGRKGGITASKTKAASRAAAAAALTSRDQQTQPRHQNYRQRGGGGAAAATHMRSPAALEPLSPSPTFDAGAMTFGRPAADYYTPQLVASRSASTFTASRCGTLTSTNSPFIKTEASFEEPPTPQSLSDPASASSGLGLTMPDLRAPPMYYYHHHLQQQQPHQQPHHQQQPEPYEPWAMAGANTPAGVAAGMSRFGDYSYSLGGMVGMYDELPEPQDESAIYVGNQGDMVGLGCGPLRQWGQEHQEYLYHQDGQHQEQQLLEGGEGEKKKKDEGDSDGGTHPETMEY